MNLETLQNKFPSLAHTSRSIRCCWLKSEKYTHANSNIVPPPLLFIYCPFARGSKNYIFAHCFVFYVPIFAISILLSAIPLSTHFFSEAFPFDDRYLEIHNDAFDDTIMKMRKHCQHAKSLFVWCRQTSFPMTKHKNISSRILHFNFLCKYFSRHADEDGNVPCDECGQI